MQINMPSPKKMLMQYPLNPLQVTLSLLAIELKLAKQKKNLTINHNRSLVYHHLLL